MIKIIFPFYKRYPRLKIFWWHRLFIVLFFIFIITTFLFLWLDSNIAEQKKQDQCMNDAFDYGLRTQNYEYQNILLKSCGESGLYTVHRRRNIIFAIVAAVIASYVLQFIYYKVFLYIIYGNKLNNLKSSV